MYSKWKWAICSRCNGHAKHDPPAFSNGFTSSEWADMGPDDQATYMRGDWDVKCETCNGSGKVQIPDIESMTFSEKRQYILDERERAADAAAERAIRAEEAAERRFGC